MPKAFLTVHTLDSMGVRKCVEKQGTFLIPKQDFFRTEDPKIGIEIEVPQDSGIFQLRKAIWMIENSVRFNLLPPNTYTKYATVSEMFQRKKDILNIVNPRELADLFICGFFQEYVFKTSEILMEPPSYDGGGLECVVFPGTMEAMYLISPELQRILNMYEELGFTDKINGAALQPNYDYTFFGETILEQEETMKRFLWFLFKNSQEMLAFSNRSFRSQVNADMFSMLGDALILKDYEENERIFLSLKDKGLEFLRTRTSGEILGVHFSKAGRASIEFKWFGATTDLEEMFGMMEFGICLANFLKSIPDITYCEWFRFTTYLQSQKEYTHLKKFLIKKNLFNVF